ncbi:hypothetical protein [Microcoleus sp. FACHB-672]|uniref:hypothetical protein n=1 Tax=Microcoleus sp. FACHB-672 TaxID=2692825 RepID=UPI0016836530|nr:hypothetical protein [Microcoleus sp. FACHB-672]MBD2043539.1 hypothetical protein [Microcoleus sp. FACHB-672]
MNANWDDLRVRSLQFSAAPLQQLNARSDAPQRPCGRRLTVPAIYVVVLDGIAC